MAGIVVIILVGAAFGIPYQYGWIGHPSGTTTSSTTAETTFTKDATFTINAGSSEVQILKVYAYFYKIEPGTVNDVLLNATRWEYHFIVLVVWKNISPHPVYYDNACGDENTMGQLMPTTTADVKLVPYGGCTRAGGYVALNPGNRTSSHFPGLAHGTTYVIKGGGSVEISLTLIWSTDSSYTHLQNLNLTASFNR